MNEELKQAFVEAITPALSMAIAATPFPMSDEQRDGVIRIAVRAQAAFYQKTANGFVNVEDIVTEITPLTLKRYNELLRMDVEAKVKAKSDSSPMIELPEHMLIPIDEGPASPDEVVPEACWCADGPLCEVLPSGPLNGGETYSPVDKSVSGPIRDKGRKDA